MKTTDQPSDRFVYDGVIAEDNDEYQLISLIQPAPIQTIKLQGHQRAKGKVGDAVIACRFSVEGRPYWFAR